MILDYLNNRIKTIHKITHEVICLKDSRSVSDATREDLIQAIKKSAVKNILVTHGTYTMVDSAIYLQKRFAEFQEYKVIFTGSFYPIRGFAESDAGFNLGYAIAAFDSAKPGVYVAMNGCLFSPNSVRKNVENACFEIA